MSDACTVIFLNEFGQILNRDGSCHCIDSSHNYFRQSFGDLESAKQFCYAVVKELPHVECNIVRGEKFEQTLFCHFDAEWRQRETGRRHRAYAEMKRRDRMVVFAIIGIIVLVVIGALLLWLH